MPVKKTVVKKEVVKSVKKAVASKVVKTAVLKVSAKTSLKPEISKVVTKRVTAITSKNLLVPVYSLIGKTSTTLSLPEEIFGVKVNKNLLLQAVRVYSTNQKMLLGHTKTRGEVKGSTAKIYRQKGTGRARHGGIRAPIFVGGGIVFGPQSRKVHLDLPKRMKKAALIAALSSKALDKNIVGISGLEKALGKTKEMVKFMSQVANFKQELTLKDKKNTHMNALIITHEKQDNVVRAVKNIPGVNVLSVNLLNAYEILKHNILLISKDAVEKLANPTKKVQE